MQVGLENGCETEADVDDLCSRQKWNKMPKNDAPRDVCTNDII